MHKMSKDIIVHKISLVFLFHDERVMVKVFFDFHKLVAVLLANIVDNHVHFVQKLLVAN